MGDGPTAATLEAAEMAKEMGLTVSCDLNYRKKLWMPEKDRALQRSTAEVLSAIYEQDFLNCSFGGRLGRGAHNALATLNEIIAEEKVGWVLEADLKNFFGSLNHEWMLQFVQHRVGDTLETCVGEVGVLRNRVVAA